tara:strand:- start:3 stop:212 length:210 start_codon:yes stop_codon:yes gene_type:complete
MFINNNIFITYSKKINLIIGQSRKKLFYHLISLIPMIVPNETPIAKHNIPFVVKPVICPRKVLNTESKS